MPGMAGGAQRGVFVVGLRLVLEKVGSNAGKTVYVCGC